MDETLKKSFPELSKAKLAKAETQKEDGNNYRMTYTYKKDKN